MKGMKTAIWYKHCNLLLLFVCIWPLLMNAKPKPSKEKQYYPNGQLEAAGWMVNGLKHKRWEYYSVEGLRIKTEKWNQGTLRWQIWYTAKGKIAKTIDSKGKEKIRPACGCS